MSNLWTNQFGDGYKSAPRGLRVGYKVFSLFLVLGLLVSAGSAWAAEVTEVRVGRHPTFTRLVFQLDRAAGYRVQRTDAGADSELVISLEASSMPRNLRPSTTLIEQVDITPSGSRSVARIRLKEDGFRLKEMILSNPPRIVLDLVSERAVAKAAARKSKTTSIAKAKTASKTASKSAATATSKATPKTAARTMAGTTVKAAAKPVAETAEKLAANTAKLADSAKSTANAAKDEAVTTAKSAAKVTSDTVANAASKSKELASNAGAAASGTVADLKKKAEELSFDDIVDRNSADAKAQASDAATKVAKATPNPQTPAKTPRPMVAKKKTQDEGGWMTWALVGAGVLVAGGLGLLFARRRGGDEEVDFSEGEDEVDFGDEAATAMHSDADENPFAELAGSQGSVADAAATTVTPFADDDGMDGEDTTIVPLPDDEKESETMVFESAEENDMDDMEVISRDQVNESLGGAAMPPVGGIPEEFQQMMREMNRRVESLEGRVEELVDARDRLERQVAAQTEELRVQRAAIARTQRAVRNLARPEDAGEEEATEPALRDPNQ